MKHLIALFALTFAWFALEASLKGNVALGFPVLLVASCTIGAVYAQLEGVGLAVIVVGIGVGFLVNWWIAAFVIILGIRLVAMDPSPTTPFGMVVDSWDLGAGTDGSGDGGC